MSDDAQRRQHKRPRGPRGNARWLAVAVAVAAVSFAGGLIVLERDEPTSSQSPSQGKPDAPSASGPPDPDPELDGEPGEVLFEDDFDRLDPEAWLVADYPADVNDEKQHYTPDNVTTRDGTLVITSERREIQGREFASGLVSTAGRFAFTYGRVEWSAKLPKGKGVWPALWLNGQDCAQTFQNASQRCPTWPQRGSDEIDIAELRGSEPHKVHMTQHYNPHGQEHDIPNECEWDGPDMSEDFHTYGLEWTPDALVWYVDGVERCRATDPVPDTPKFLIMNTAVGGHYDGDPDEHTGFPVEHEIDWVRVTALH